MQKTKAATEYMRLNFLKDKNIVWYYIIHNLKSLRILQYEPEEK